MQENGKLFSLPYFSLFKNYFNFNYISDPKRFNMMIHKALLKYGYSGFQLEILEYCNKNELIAKEQYYLDLLTPEYNILKKAGSSLGFKHSLETRQKMSNSQIRIGNKGRFKTGVMSGENHPLYGKKGIDSARFGKKHSE